MPQQRRPPQIEYVPMEAGDIKVLKEAAKILYAKAHLPLNMGLRSLLVSTCESLQAVVHYSGINGEVIPEREIHVTR